VYFSSLAKYPIGCLALGFTDSWLAQTNPGFSFNWNGDLPDRAAELSVGLCSNPNLLGSYT